MWKELKTIGGVIFVAVVIFGIIGILSFASRAEAAEPAKPKVQKSVQQSAAHKKARGKAAAKTEKKAAKAKSYVQAKARSPQPAKGRPPQNAPTVQKKSKLAMLPLVASALPGHAIEKFIPPPCPDPVCRGTFIRKNGMLHKVAGEDDIFLNVGLRMVGDGSAIVAAHPGTPEWQKLQQEYYAQNNSSRRCRPACK